MKENELLLPSFQTVIRESLREALQLNSEKCFECKLCVKECAFLQKYGTPKQIADTYDPASRVGSDIGFECSLCGLCGAVCPAALNPAEMFMEMRREAVDRGTMVAGRYNLLLNYEKRGTSKLFSWYGLPENCRTVLFPGCALSGSRPAAVKKLHEHLSHVFPDLGIVFDCCTKPSHDLGLEQQFRDAFDELKTFLLSHGVGKVLVACPSCRQVFHEYGGALEVETVYEHLTDPPVMSAIWEGEAVVHDACATRENTKIHQAVRTLAAERSITVREMDHRGMKTFCCGEGGAVHHVKQVFSEKWTQMRMEEADGKMILTYCAGCSHFLGRTGSAHHILDLIFDADKVKSGQVKVSKTPFTYLNRLRLKSYFRKNMNSSVSHERGASSDDNKRGRKIFIILTCLAALLAVVSIPLFLLVAFF